jgi:hypothetical protein
LNSQSRPNHRSCTVAGMARSDCARERIGQPVAAAQGVGSPVMPRPSSAQAVLRIGLRQPR